MDLNRLRLEERIAGGAALLLFIDLFLNWYGSSVANSEINSAKAAAAAAGINIPNAPSADISGWSVFSYTDLWILLLVIVTIGALALRATANEAKSPIPLSGVAAVLSVWVAILVVYRVIINKPGPGGVGISADFGAYLGIVFAIVLAVQWVRLAMSEGSLDDLMSRASTMTAGVTSGGGGGASRAAAAPPPPPAAPAAPVAAPPAAPPPAAAPPPPAAAPPPPAPPVPPAPPGPPQPPTA
jgi:hypothetical protein